MKKYKIGYTQGTFDMFHIGHLNLLNNAKQYCDRLIVGVNSDELVRAYKHKTPVINEAERREIVGNIKAVDDCKIVSTLDKEDALSKFGFDAIFIGDDWRGDPRWLQTERDLARYGVDVVYLPHTKGISSTALADAIMEIIDNM
ncbi:MAG: adenylyltransferase/cytidyltransferase family protein, partial [Clostridia bacterium]|nr:adenylyltransferase/cytidyltransferase family protein [Clostridia bacterium]